MAGTHYGALNFTLEEEKKPQPLRKAGAVAAVVVAVCVMFFAGRVTKSLTTPFTHEEVMNVVTTCGEGQFIGGCKTCQKCQPYEFDNGGCTYFKDTFCSYCEKIPHCDRTDQICTKPVRGKKFGGAKRSSMCLKCQCKKPIERHQQKTKEQIDYYKNSWSAKKRRQYRNKRNIFSCFFNKAKPWSSKGDGAKNPNAPVPLTTCKACTVCPRKYFQPKDGACKPTKDTVCKPCTVCKPHEYTARVCTYNSDTVCKKCLNCVQINQDRRVFTWMKEQCTSRQNKNVYFPGRPGVCAPCSVNGRKKTGKPYFFISKACRAGKYRPVGSGLVYVPGTASDTQFKWCNKCIEGQYISKTCMAGAKNPFRKGHKTQCTPCTLNRGCAKPNKPGSQTCRDGRYKDKQGTSIMEYQQFRSRKCSHTKRRGGDALYQNCRTCEAWQFQSRQCAIQCNKRNRNGKCFGGRKHGKRCKDDGGCGTCLSNGKPCLPGPAGDKYCRGFCAGVCNGLCSIGNPVEQKFSEDGDMTKPKGRANELGIQTGCGDCPNQFIVGKNGKDEPVARYSAGLKKRCSREHKRCSRFVPSGKFTQFGFKKAPTHTTCTGNCDNDQKEKWGNCCRGGALGESCDWTRLNRRCHYVDTVDGKKVGLPYRVRTVKTGGYKGFRKKGLQANGMRHPFVKNTGTNPEMFVRWCASLCEDFPSCVQFQLKSCLTKDKQACGVADSTQCLLYNKRWAGPPKPTKKMVKDLKALDDKKKMWTCGDGEAVGFQTKGWFAGKGFRCTKAGKLNVPKENKKCKSFQCKNDAKNCCGNDEWVCYTKPNAQLKFQQASV